MVFNFLIAIIYCDVGVYLLEAHNVGFHIRITFPCVLYPLTPYFYTVKLGFTGVIIFLFLLLNIDCGYSLEPPHRGGSNVYPQYMF